MFTKNRLVVILLSLLLISTLIVAVWYFFIRDTSEDYNPTIVPEDFSTTIDNKYFSLPVGREFTYEGETSDGIETVTVQILDETREIAGVQTVVYEDTVKLDGKLIEYTKDYLAQDKDGNVWYFGEDVDNYDPETGELTDHDGSWLTGVDGAKPGFWMKAGPKVGDTYRQEYYKGEAEDMADVKSISETVTTAIATYYNCLKTFDYTPLEPDLKENKYYCPEVGAMVLEENVADDERVELIEITN